jgi:phospholipid/cholesterol/gamma-HCH transport system substrate-binding protein
MRDLSTEVKVGAVVILAIVILLYAIVWVKEYKFGADRMEVTAAFPEIGTLEVGDPVGVLGVDKGSVKDINLEGDEVLLTLALDKDVQLRKDATISIANIGLMGERAVAINPGKADEPYDLAKPLEGKYDTGISEVFGMMGEIMSEVRSLIAALEGTFGKDGQGENINNLISDLQELADNANSFFYENESAMKSTITDLSSSAAKMKAFLDSNEVELSESAANMAKLSENMTELTERLNALTTKVELGEDTLGKTLADDSLYYDIRTMVNNLDSLITDFKENPGRYVKVSIF